MSSDWELGKNSVYEFFGDFWGFLGNPRKSPWGWGGDGDNHMVRGFGWEIPENPRGDRAQWGEMDEIDP